MKGFNLDDKRYTLGFLKRSLMECNHARPITIIFISVTVVFSEKHWLVRNDFLDYMMELRQAGKDEAQGDVQSARNANIGATFKIDDDLFVAQASTFLLGGYGTSGSTLSLVLYELAFHPEIQQSLRADILQVLSQYDRQLIYDCIQQMSYLDRVVSGSTVEVKATMARFTTDVIASCAFGINSNSLKDPNSEFARRITTILVFSVQKGLVAVMALFAPYLNKVFHLNFLDEKTNNYVRQIVWNAVEYREKHGLVRNDFLDCMMELRQASKDETQGDVQSARNANTGTTFKIDGDLFVAQALIFLMAGYETSSSTLSFALYELAFQPEIQQSLRAEILQVLSKHDGKLTYDGIQDMSYLDRVVSETLRKYPIVPFLERNCCSDYELPASTGTGTITLPAGTGVYIPVLALHYDPTYFPEPQKFDPDRFTEENKQSRPHYTYLPFGEGPRNCIGTRFGLMQVKTGLCYILSRFEVAPCKETTVPVALEPKAVTLQMHGEIRLSFNRKQF